MSSILAISVVELGGISLVSNPGGGGFPPEGQMNLRGGHMIRVSGLCPLRQGSDGILSPEFEAGVEDKPSEHVQKKNTHHTSKENKYQ